MLSPKVVHFIIYTFLRLCIFRNLGISFRTLAPGGRLTSETKIMSYFWTCVSFGVDFKTLIK